MIIATISGNGFTRDLYDSLRQEVGWETDQIDGWIVHAVRFDESGEIQMVNVWDSLDDMSEAFANRLGPVMRKIGIPQPRVEVHDAYNVNVFATTFQDTGT